MNGGLEISLGVRGNTEVKQEQEGSEASKAATHACKTLRASLKRVDKPLKALTCLKRTFRANASVEGDKDVAKWREASAHIDSVCDNLEKFSQECEEICAATEHELKAGIDNDTDDRESAVNKFEEMCKQRAKQCDDFRKSADTHTKNASAKVAEMKFKIAADPSEWDAGS